MPAASVTPAILTVRTECSGGPIAQQVEASQGLHGFNRLTILIHGYNNSACVAQHSYKDFLGLADVNDASVFALFGQLCAFYWPGDACDIWKRAIRLAAGRPGDKPRMRFRRQRRPQEFWANFSSTSRRGEVYL